MNEHKYKYYSDLELVVRKPVCLFIFLPLQSFYVDKNDVVKPCLKCIQLSLVQTLITQPNSDYAKESRKSGVHNHNRLALSCLAGIGE